MKNVDASRKEVACRIKKDDFWDEDEKIVRMSQLIEMVMNIASNKHPVISLKSKSLI